MSEPNAGTDVLGMKPTPCTMREKRKGGFWNVDPPTELWTGTTLAIFFIGRDQERWIS
jgi:hypothetical protein